MSVKDLSINSVEGRVQVLESAPVVTTNEIRCGHATFTAGVGGQIGVDIPVVFNSDMPADDYYIGGLEVVADDSGTYDPSAGQTSIVSKTVSGFTVQDNTGTTTLAEGESITIRYFACARNDVV